MSFIHHLFSFFHFKDEDIQMPEPVYPYTPSIYPKKKNCSFVLSKPTIQSISTQTEQTISNLTTAESETEISIPASFVPKEISYTFLSSRFRSINYEKNKKSKGSEKVSKSHVNASQRNEDNISDQEFSVGSNQASSNASGDESLSSTQQNLTLNSNVKSKVDGEIEFSSVNFKPKEEEKSVDTFYIPSKKQVKKEEETADTFYIPSKKQVKKEEETADTFYIPSKKQVKKEEEITDTFYITNKKQDKKEEEVTDTFFMPNKKQDKKEEKEADTFYFPGKKQDKKEEKEEEKSLDTFYLPGKSQPKKEVDNNDTFSFTNFKSKQSTTDSEKNAAPDSGQKKELDIDAIKAIIHQKYLQKSFSTYLETNFDKRNATIRYESGGFNYAAGGGQSYTERPSFKKSSRGGGSKRFKRNFNE